MEIKTTGVATINIGVIKDNSVRIDKLITYTKFEDNKLQPTISLINELNKMLKERQSDENNIASSLSQEVLPELEKGNEANKGKLKEFFRQLPEKVTYYGAPIVKIANELVALWTKLV